jgi:hypothetical protein
MQTHIRAYPKVSGLAVWSKHCKWYSSLPLGAVVLLFCEFCHHNPLCCFSTSVYCCKHIFHWLSAETFGYTLVQVGLNWIISQLLSAVNTSEQHNQRNDNLTTGALCGVYITMVQILLLDLHIDAVTGVHLPSLFSEFYVKAHKLEVMPLLWERTTEIETTLLVRQEFIKAWGLKIDIGSKPKRDQSCHINRCDMAIMSIMHVLNKQRGQ